MKTLADYAIKAFNEGSDYFKEKVIGTCELEHRTYDKSNPHYTMTVLLEQEDGHKCTSGIGFYPYSLPNDSRKLLRACSGHMLPWVIEITPEIQSELDKAIHIEGG
jgi:hypothetical protein